MANYSGKFARNSKKSGKKSFTAIVAVVLTAALLFGGTFAWQSISQEALNEVAGTVNPGGRLHDDFVDITYDEDGVAQYETMTYNKDVYVENFTSLANNGVQVFARVRLDEYMEFGLGAGRLNTDGSLAPDNEAVSLVPGAKLEDKSTWRTHIYGEDAADPFHKFWTWDFSGKTTYMPTFNKDKTSLEADINGTFDAAFEDYTDYTLTENATKEATAYYEGTTDANGNYTPKTATETHTAKSTLDSYVIPMSQYIQWLNNDNPSDDFGNFWVYDTDGWAYWANPINPDTATGLLLDGIGRTTEIINEDWYYGINVVAQFITGDDLGQGEGTGFFDLSEGSEPTLEALQLLNAIGVEVTFEASTEEELTKALVHGGTIKLTDNVSVTAPLVVGADTVLELGNYTISPAADTTVWNEESKNWSLISVRGADTTLTINSGETGGVAAAANDSFCVDVRDGAKVIINGGTYAGNISAVYVHAGEAVISGGTFSIQQVDTNGYDQMINCYNENYENGTAVVTVLGGSFYDFDPDNADDGDLVPRGYTVSGTTEGNTTIYTVEKSAQTETTPVA